MQVLFGYLEISQKKYYDTIPFCNVLRDLVNNKMKPFHANSFRCVAHGTHPPKKTIVGGFLIFFFFFFSSFLHHTSQEGGNLNINEQKDVNEFFSLLFDQLESNLKVTEQRKVLHEHFGGVLVNQIISEVFFI